MAAEFDKEMDALLRRVAGGGVPAGGAAKSHLDADTIAAFAENSLPVKSRTIYTQHLAECDPCRISLANLISVNAESQPALAAAAAPVPALSVPWYRRLFLGPNLAYVMGGLVLIFGGLLGVIVLRSSYSSDTATLSKVAEAPETQTAPARAEGANSLYSTNTASNSPANVPGEIPRSVGVAESTEQAPEAATGTAAAPPPPPVVVGDNSPTALAKDLSTDGVDKAKPSQPLPATANAPKREEDAKEKNEAKLAAAEQQARKQDADQTNIFRNQQNQMMPNSAAKSVGPSRNDIQRDNRAYDDLRGRSSADTAGAHSNVSPPATRQAGGKTFEFKQGAWYETTFSGQKTKNVRRSSVEYGKLDAGLRSIADSIGGTVVVVWKGQAYRIQ